MSQIKQVIIAELVLDEDTEYVSGERVRRFTTASPPTLSVVYSGTVMSWGVIEKSIPCPAGMPHIGNATIRISDHWRHWRDLLARNVFRRRVMRITQLPEGSSLADYDPLFVGEVQDVVTYSAGYIEIELRDRLFAWVDEEIPAMAIRELYPEVTPEDEGGFIPIVVGEMVTEDDNSPSTGSPQGLVPLPHIGMVQAGSPPTPYDRWGVALDPVIAVTPYRRQTASVDEDITTPEWVPVSAAEYTLREIEFSAVENPFGAFTMTHTVLDFHQQQPDGTEIRADIRGIYFRGAWGSLPEVDGSLASPRFTLRNPIDAFINFSYLLMRKAGLSPTSFDSVEIGELRTLFESLDYVADFAITQPMTGREWLGQFLASYCLVMTVNREGKITLKYIRDASESSPDLSPIVFKEGKHILKNTFIERLPEVVITQLVLLWRYNNALGKFDRRLVIDTSEQESLNLIDENSPATTTEKIEKAELALYCVRDDDTAEEIASRHLAFLSLGSFRQEFQMPLPATIDDVELGEQCGLTHSMGIDAPDGYNRTRIVPLRILYDLDRQIITVNSVRYPAFQIANVASGAGAGRPTIAEEWEDPAFVNPARSRIENGFRAIDNDFSVGNSLTYAECQIDSTRPITPNYAQLHIYGFPEPAPPGGQSLQTITIKAVVEYVLPDDSGGTPGAFVTIYNDYTNDLIPTIPDIPLFTDGGALEPGLAKATYSAAIPLVDWAASFGSSAANIYVRCMQWHSLFQNFPQTIKLRIYDIWIEYTYA